MSSGTVLFVCQHGAGKSRIAAAWFGVLAPAGWTATTAGVAPQATPSQHAPRLLAGTPALAHLDPRRPRPLAAVPEPDLVVSIDCPAGAVPAQVRWSLEHGEFGAPMAAELQARVLDLVARLGGGGADANA